MPEQTFETERFLNLFLEVLRFNTLEQFKFKLKKEIGIQNPIGSVRNGILLPKLFWPTVRKNCSSDQKKLLKF
jgi:hypothetical protein